jgi:hypothetical protein
MEGAAAGCGASDGDDLGNHVAGAFDADRVADVEAEAGDFVFVVEGGAGDGDAADLDVAEDGDGREGAGAADLDEDVLDDGFGVAGGVFEGDSPAGGLGGEAEEALLGDGIDFGDDAVDFVGESFAAGFHFLAEEEELLDGGAEAAVGIDFEAEAGEFVEGGGMGVQGGLAVAEEVVGVEVELAGGGNGGIEDAEGAGGGIAGVGVEGLAVLLALFVEAIEGVAGHDDFAADLKGLLEGDAQGQATDGTGVFGDILAGKPVAAGDGALEQAAGVVDGEGEAIELEFGGVGEGLSGEEVADAAVEIAELAFVEGVVEAEHGRGVAEFDETVAGLAADALGGGIGRNNFRVICFESLEFAQEGVVVRVGNGGTVQNVIKMFVAFDFGAQGGRFFRNRGQEEG